MTGKLALAITAAALAAPGSALAGSWQGVVVAKDSARKAIVTASANGAVRTVRAPKAMRGVHVGTRVTVQARRLADGTFRGTKVQSRGRVARAKLRAILVRHDRAAGRYLVSAGGTVLSVRARTARRTTASSSDGVKPGDRLVIVVTVGPDGTLQVTTLSTVGHAGALELEGIFLGVTDGKLQLAVAHRGLIQIAVPAGFVLPALSPGDLVEAVVTVAADGTFTLVAVQEDDPDDDGIDLDDEGEVEVEGVITALPTATSPTISVRAGRGASVVTCRVPAGTTLTGFSIGDRVEMECRVVNGSELVLRDLEHEEEDEDDDDEDEDEDEDDDEDED